MMLSCDRDQVVNPVAVKDVLVLSSDKEFNSTSDLIVNSSDDKLLSWEQSKGFVSLRTVWKNAMSEVSSSESYDDFLSIAKKYSDISFVKDSALVPFIDIRLYQSIVNRSGLYAEGDRINKVIGEYIISVPINEVSKLSDLSHTSDITSLLTNKEFKVFRYTGDSYDESGRKMSSCSTYQEASYYDNPSGCKNDREVYVSARSYTTRSTTWEGDWITPRVELKVWGRIRNNWCNWKNYETQLEYRNASFHIMAFTFQNGVASPVLVSQDAIGDYAPQDDRRDLRWDQQVGERVLNMNFSGNPFIDLHFEGKSRGAGDNYAVLDCR